MRATYDWCYLGCRPEQVLAEANAMLPAGTTLVELQDEFGTGQLAFYADRAGWVWLAQADRQGRVGLDRSCAPGDQAVAPEDTASLEDLVVELLAQDKESGHG